jgi:hypothetical protein
LRHGVMAAQDGAEGNGFLRLTETDAGLVRDTEALLCCVSRLWE